METPSRKPYPSDVSDEEWFFVAPYLTLMSEDAPQRTYPLREVFNGLRFDVKTGAPWRWLPHDLPPWEAAYQQSQRWLRAGVFEAIVHDLRALLRLAAGRAPEPTAVVLDARTLQSSPECGHRAGYDGHKRKKGSKTHAAVDTLGHLLAPLVAPASAQERAQVEALARRVQDVTGRTVELAYVDQGYTGDTPAEAAQAHGIRLEVVQHPEAKRGFVLLPRRWVVDTTQPQDPRDARLDETERAADDGAGGAAGTGRAGRDQAQCPADAARGRGRAMPGLAVVAGPPRPRRSGAPAGGSGSRRPTVSACWGCSAAC
jgi:transposase